MYIRATPVLGLVFMFVSGLLISVPMERREQINNKQEAYLLPSEVVMPLAAYQPDSPIKLELVQLRGHTDGRSTQVLVRFRNRSKRKITAYTIAYVTTGGMGEEWSSTKADINQDELLPEKNIPTSDGAVSLTDRQKKILGFNEMQALCVFMVVHAELDDGSVYDARKVYKALKNYFEKAKS